MRYVNLLPLVLCVASLAGCQSRRESKIEISLPERFDGKQIELISYEDSVVLAKDTVTNGHAEFTTMPSDSVRLPLLAQLVIDGRVRGFYVIEPGVAHLDSLKGVSGTPLNDRLANLMSRMDSVDATGDMEAYTAMAEKIYNENKENVLGGYFGIEWLKYADPMKIDSAMQSAPARLRESRRARHYITFGKLRAQTAPGQKYVDFSGDDSNGQPVNISRYIVPGKYTLVDFMASWCPYCIKDFKTLRELQEKYSDKGLNLVSVAVRDKPEDTAAAVERHGLDWNVVYNTGRKPYDIYGFSGIPHYMLIGPDGTIEARGETLSKIAEVIAEKL